MAGPAGTRWAQAKYTMPAMTSSIATTSATQAGRSSAVGLYVTSFYIGGSFGAAR